MEKILPFDVKIKNQYELSEEKNERQDIQLKEIQEIEEKEKFEREKFEREIEIKKKEIEQGKEKLEKEIKVGEIIVKAKFEREKFEKEKIQRDIMRKKIKEMEERMRIEREKIEKEQKEKKEKAKKELERMLIEREKERRNNIGFGCTACLEHFRRQKHNFFPIPPYNGTSIVEGLKSIGVNSSFNFRATIAIKNGINNYTGMPGQNIHMLYLLKYGRLLIP